MTRSFITITGDDRISFLQGILTQDVTKLPEAGILFAALLSPQGKLLHDMFLIDHAGAILIDTAAEFAPMLLKRLTMYKLRAKVSIADDTANWHLTLGTGLPDPRHPELPARSYTRATQDVPAPVHSNRIALAIPEFGIDIAPDSMTAMDAGYDLLHAISFTKGCYVGQEVTARMHYKAIARKGFFHVRSAEPLAPGDSLMQGDRTIGSITSSEGTHAISFLKFEDALDGTPTVNHHPVKITVPAWMQPKLDLFNDAANKQ